MIETARDKQFLRPRGLRIDPLMRYYFGSNALLSLVVLILITVFLFREGFGFFPQNLRNLRLYRQAGLEYVDIVRARVDEHTGLSRYLQAIRQKEINRLLAEHVNPGQAVERLSDFDRFSGEFDKTANDLRSLLSDMTEMASAIKEKGGKAEESGAVSPDFKTELVPLLGSFPVYQKTSEKLCRDLEDLLARIPAQPVPGFEPSMEKFKKLATLYIAGFPAAEAKMKSWNPLLPVPWYRAVSSFLFGRDWITNSFWQDFFGVLPLLCGSVMIAVIALSIAVPFGVCSAVYVSEFASIHEQRLIKPYIEFISAIPSVVLGFFGVAMLGQTLRMITQISILSWVPGFPISERLNAFTAGVLLAIMAIPTIFTLSEDALNNVPRGFKEASYALGATRLQTMARIVIPSSLSGILSAVLLGFGRVIGETMVVLLCAGNRIAIPDFTQGIASIFQPVHTMTGIIAQELGEVPRGSIHWRALFMVGILLFFLSLIINYIAQHIVRKFKISIG